MESFRNLIKGWLGKLLLTVILVLFAFVGMEGYFSGGLPADAAKTVNGKTYAAIAMTYEVTVDTSAMPKQ